MNELTPTSALINTGGVVKDSPYVNPIDLIYATNASDTAPMDGPTLYTPIPISNASPLPAAITVPNVATVGDGTTKNNNGLLLAAAGLGALLLFSKDAEKAVSGITGIGKKDKKKKDSSLLPLLIVGGAAAWYFLKPAADSTTTTTTTTTTPPVNNNTPPGVTTPAVGVGIPDPTAGVALPNDTDIYNQLFAYSVPWRYAVDRMSTAERQVLWKYIWLYVKKGLHLYNYAGNYPDGFYDPTFYAQVLALSNKWHLDLLY